MIIYQPWIEIGDARGEYSIHNLSFHLSHKTATKELEEKISEWGKYNTPVIVKKGISEITVVE